MVAIAPDGAAGAEGPIDRLCQPHREPLAAAGEPGRTVCFDEQVQVIVLHTEVEDAERGTGDGGQRAVHGVERAAITERRDARRGPQGDVDREPRIVPDSTPVGYCPPLRSGGASSARASAAPRTEDERSLCGATHLE
jgi:hypothetical protein